MLVQVATLRELLQKTAQEQGIGAQLVEAARGRLLVSECARGECEEEEEKADSAKHPRSLRCAFDRRLVIALRVVAVLDVAVALRRLLQKVRRLALRARLVQR